MEGNLIQKKKKRNSISYTKWGYIFIAPFFIVYAIFSLYPLLTTFYYSFFEHYRVGLSQVGPNFVGLDNFKSLLTGADLLKYAGNTVLLWLIGFLPQILVSLLLAVWFTDLRLRLRATTFFKTVIYMPNLIMAAAFSMLIWTLFSDNGPINQILIASGNEQIRFLSSIDGTRGLIALINFLMWFGNTTIMLMAGVMGIDNTLFEAAEIDGASSWQIFTKVTIPLLRPILVYVLMTSMIGGIQMFDVPQIFTNGTGNPARTSMTLIMYLNKHLYSKNYGMAGALSVMLFIVTAIISFFVYRSLTAESRERKKAQKGI